MKNYRGIAGARIGFGEMLRFGAYGHIGIGRLSYPTAPNSGSLILNPDHTGFTFDLGAFIDFTAIPFVELGIQLGYGNSSTLEFLDPLQWINAGVHAALVF